jgi:hypothetical protein
MACTWLSSHPGPPESLGDPCQSLWATSQTCGELFCAGYTWAPRPEHSQYPSGCCTSIGHLGHCRWPWQAGGSPPSLTWPHRDTSASASAVFLHPLQARCSTQLPRGKKVRLSGQRDCQVLQASNSTALDPRWNSVLGSAILLLPATCAARIQVWPFPRLGGLPWGAGTAWSPRDGDCA